MDFAPSESPTDLGIGVLKVQKPILLAFIWGGLALAIICCSLRFLARFRSFKKLLVDDYFVVLALCCLLANAIVWQIYARDMYHILAVSAGLEMPEEGYARLAESYFRSGVAAVILFYSTLWSIKISFLLLFKRLCTNVRGQQLMWWLVFGFTVATYFACIGTIQYPCLVSSFRSLAACRTSAATSFQKITLKLNCAWDVITDCLIMFIPFSMLKGVQMNWRRKAALSGIFSLVVITMVFAVARTALIGSSNTTKTDSSLLWMWSAIEASIAVIVACLATFHNLFSGESSRHRLKKPVAPAPSNLYPYGNGRRKKTRDILDSLESMADHAHWEHEQHNEDTSGSQSIADYHHRDAHDLNEMPRAV
ncbi:MAG: hypothetical protein Q9178_006239 [Gyalolechia marmorata]